MSQKKKIFITFTQMLSACYFQVVWWCIKYAAAKVKGVILYLTNDMADPWDVSHLHSGRCHFWLAEESLLPTRTLTVYAPLFGGSKLCTKAVRCCSQKHTNFLLTVSQMSQKLHSNCYWLSAKHSVLHWLSHSTNDSWTLWRIAGCWCSMQ